MTSKSKDTRTDSDGTIPYLKRAVNEPNGRRVSNANTLKHISYLKHENQIRITGFLIKDEKKICHTYIIGDKAVPSPLREKADSQDDTHAASVPGRFEEGQVRRRRRDFSFHRECLSNLPIREIDQWVSLSSIGMIFRQHIDRLYIVSICY